jgi:hypothetical protein
MKYQANPVIVDAFIIIGVGPILGSGSMHLALQNGEDVIATAAQMSRYIPQEGDYWVVQQDGYTYLNPKAVFERKYAPIVEEAPIPPWRGGATCKGCYAFGTACGQCDRCDKDRVHMRLRSAGAV